MLICFICKVFLPVPSTAHARSKLAQMENFFHDQYGHDQFLHILKKKFLLCISGTHADSKYGWRSHTVDYIKSLSWTPKCPSFIHKKYFLHFKKVGTRYQNIRWLGRSVVSCRWLPCQRRPYAESALPGPIASRPWALAELSYPNLQSRLG